MTTGSPDDPRLRGFGPIGLLAMAVVLLGNVLFPGGAGLLVLIWARLSRTPWRDIGYVRPRSWIGTLALGIVLGFMLELTLKAIVMRMLGAPAINPAYRNLVGNASAVPGFLFTIIVGAGFGEETVFRGFLFERLGKLLGHGRPAKFAIILVTSLLFGLAHYGTQGWAGVEQSAVTGAVFGTCYALAGRIWLPIVIHATFDLTAYALIYWNLAPTVATLLFK
jgi:membrane protease YdiL (CAAX protease family)